jgi:hypothetical protein
MARRRKADVEFSASLNIEEIQAAVDETKAKLQTLAGQRLQVFDTADIRRGKELLRDTEERIASMDATERRRAAFRERVNRRLEQAGLGGEIQRLRAGARRGELPTQAEAGAVGVSRQRLQNLLRAGTLSERLQQAQNEERRLLQEIKEQQLESLETGKRVANEAYAKQISQLERLLVLQRKRVAGVKEAQAKERERERTTRRRSDVAFGEQRLRLTGDRARPRRKNILFTDIQASEREALRRRQPKDPAISMTSQKLLALGSILTPLNRALGTAVLQSGFASFSFGAMAAAAFAGSAALGFWARQMNESLKLLTELGIETEEYSAAQFKLRKATETLRVALGRNVEPVMTKFANSAADLIGTLERAGAIELFTNDLVEMLDSLSEGAQILTKWSTILEDFKIPQAVGTPAGRALFGPAKTLPQQLANFLATPIKARSFFMKEFNIGQPTFPDFTGSPFLNRQINAGTPMADIQKFQMMGMSRQEKRTVELTRLTRSFQAAMKEARTARERQDLTQRFGTAAFRIDEQSRKRFIPSMVSLEQAATGLVKDVKSRDLTLEQKQQGLNYLRDISQTIRKAEEQAKTEPRTIEEVLTSPGFFHRLLGLQ